VRLSLTPDQEFFRETTVRYLEEHAPVDELRRLRHDPDGFTHRYWQGGADLGWTSLLVGEEHGGGSISGSGLIDLTLVAYEFGRHAAPGPLVPTNIVAYALATAGGGAHRDVISGLVAGTSIATWCFEEPAVGDRPGAVQLAVRVDGGQLVIDGVKRPVESAGRASHFLVTGRTGDGLTQVLVPAATEGISIQPMTTVDLTRRFAAVTFHDVRVPLDMAVGEVGGATEQVERQLQHALVLSCAEAVGAMQAAFDMTVQWAFDRYSFGRPLASYQEIKHRFADMKTWLEASHAIADAAADAVAGASPTAAEMVSIAKAYIGQYGSELVQDCVQLHGGIGVTFDHDLHLYLRRHTLNRTLFGTPEAHRQRIADFVERAEREEAA
jgi:alkylation response protein AidB-like acyl-CoA dehydrogenase